MSTERDVKTLHPKDFWQMVRRGEWRQPTIEPCAAYQKAGVCIIPKDYAVAFMTYCHRNPQPLPIIDITDVGCPHPTISPEADLRTDLPKYNIFRDGEFVEEVTDIKSLWSDDLVGFLMGCGVPLDAVLLQAGIDFVSPHALHISNIATKPAGRFGGPMAVAPRLFKNSRDIVRAIVLSSRMPFAHGTPVHIGDPSAIGIENIYRGAIKSVPEPLTASPLPLIPVWWGCGCTLELAAKDVKMPLMITQSPAHMLVTDVRPHELMDV